MEREQALEAYVRAALELQGYEFAQARIAEIVLQFSRLEAMLEAMGQCSLPYASEAASVFRP